MPGTAISACVLWFVVVAYWCWNEFRGVEP